MNAYTTGHQILPRVATDDTGGFVVVWSNSESQDGHQSGVIGRRFDADGNPLGGEFIVNTYTTNEQREPSLSQEPGGGFTVAWASAVRDGSAEGVSLQRFAADGVRIGGEVLVNTYTTSQQMFPAVAALGPEKWVVAWHSFGQDGSQLGIFGQRFGDLLFRDGFETGDSSTWSATASDGGDLGITVEAAMKFSTFGMQVSIDDTNGVYVQDDTPQDETIYRARFYFHPGDFDPGEAQNHRRTRLFIAFEEAPTRRLFALVLRRIDGQYSVMGRARRDDNTQANSVFVPISAAQHFVELRWARATSPDALDGVFELWIDGVLQASNTTLDNALSSVDFVRMGALSVKTGASGTLYFDEFESRRELPIGP